MRAEFIDFCGKIKYIDFLNAFMLAENVKNIRERIALACARANRRPEDVTLIAVSKTFSTLQVSEAVASGVHDIGESYVQEVRRKHEALRDENIRWHFIGHLQSNKVKYIAPWIDCIHAVDSEALGREISKQAEKSGRRIDVLVEVNITGEATKYGVPPDKSRMLTETLVSLPGLNVAGLMTIGLFVPDPEKSRPVFRVLRQLRAELEGTGGPLRHLSMGMTNDFEVAVEEGATMIRVGTAIFGSRMPTKQ